MRMFARFSTLAMVTLSALALTSCAADTSSDGIARRNGQSGPGGSLLNPPGLLGNGKAGGAGGPALKNSCASTTITAGRKQPIVTLVIDGSGSMCAPFGDSTRWTALRSALMDPDGIVTRLQGVVSFGMALYDGPLEFGGLFGGFGGVMAGGGMPGGGQGGQNPQCALMGAQNSMGKTCPNMVSIAPALNNAMAISAMYPMTELGGSTPTHKALKAVIDHLLELPQAPDQNLQPQFIVLATDGQPNELCANATTQDPQAEVISEVTRAADEGIKTFVISLAGDDAALMSHLVAVAQAGKTNTPPFTPMSKQDLVMSLGQIIGGAAGCEVFLNGKVAVGQECGGKVDVNGTSLKCGDPNGWVLKDESTLLLQGTACTAFQNDPFSMLNADFPCGVFSPS